MAPIIWGACISRTDTGSGLCRQSTCAPYVRAQKNDDRDAEGIAEAASRPTMRFVDLTTQEQLDTQTLHRVRSRLVAERRSLINQLRAILLERGTIFPLGRRKLELGIDGMLADEDTTFSPCLRLLVGELRTERRDLDARIEALNGEFIKLARNDAAARRLTSIPGVGVLNATALIAAVGDASSFAKARDLGAWLGLVPRQHTAGGKPRLLGISKTRQHLLAHLAHPWRPSCTAFAVAEPHAPGTMIDGHDRPSDPHRKRSPPAGDRTTA